MQITYGPSIQSFLAPFLVCTTFRRNKIHIAAWVLEQRRTVLVKVVTSEEENLQFSRMWAFGPRVNKQHLGISTSRSRKAFKVQSYLQQKCQSIFFVYFCKVTVATFWRTLPPAGLQRAGQDPVSHYALVKKKKRTNMILSHQLDFFVTCTLKWLWIYFFSDANISDSSLLMTLTDEDADVNLLHHRATNDWLKKL